MFQIALVKTWNQPLPDKITLHSLAIIFRFSATKCINRILLFSKKFSKEF